MPTRVLIAEDEADSLHALERGLIRLGFDVVTAPDGEAAAHILEAPDAPSLAVLDWSMPKIEGIEVCRQVRALIDRPYIYLILLTGRSQSHEVAAGLDAGANDYIVKPVVLTELRARLVVGTRMVKLERKLAGQVEELQDALAKIDKLKELLPICMFCKRVRDDSDYWHEIDQYIHTETGTDFSHGVCPACMARLESREIR